MAHTKAGSSREASHKHKLPGCIYFIERCAYMWKEKEEEDGVKCAVADKMSTYLGNSIKNMNLI